MLITHNSLSVMPFNTRLSCIDTNTGAVDGLRWELFRSNGELAQLAQEATP